MNYASLQFVAFLLFVFSGYWILRKRELQNWFLLVCSYYFYACWDVRFLLLIWFLTGTSFWFGRELGLTSGAVIRKRLLIIYATISLSVLGIFKYFNFFVASAQTLLTSAGINVDPFFLSIILPVGISFFTFESLSYVIEIYQGRLPSTTPLRQYALFIAYFPKLVAGPIERPAVLIPQIQRERRLGYDDFTRGLFLILLGLFKKIAIADGLAPSVDAIFASPRPPSGTDVVLATLAFAFQIYCDFSGYTDIARGVSKLLGIELSQNFRFPYFSSNPSEFWRRWHISLSSWLRDYLYIPLGGNRGRQGRTRFNLMVTMLLGGLWHGAAWNFVLWGFYQGLLLLVYQAFGNGSSLVSDARRRTAKVLGFMMFSGLMCYGWLLFRAASFAQIVTFTKTIFVGPYRIATSMPTPPIAATIGVLLLMSYDLAAYRSGRATFYRALPPWSRGGLYSCLIVVTLMGLANARSAFIYFQF